MKSFKEGGHELHTGPEKKALQIAVLNWLKSDLLSATPLGQLPNYPNRRSRARKNFGLIKIVFFLFLYFKGLQMLFNQSEETQHNSQQQIDSVFISLLFGVQSVHGSDTNQFQNIFQICC